MIGDLCACCKTPVISDERCSCPQCGSTARFLFASAVLASNSDVTCFSKRLSGNRRSSRQVIEGDDYHRKTQKWNGMRRVFDRANDRYEETFWDRDSGAVLLDKAEPLSQHRSKPKQ